MSGYEDDDDLNSKLLNSKNKNKSSINSNNMAIESEDLTHVNSQAPLVSQIQDDPKLLNLRT